MPIPSQRKYDEIHAQNIEKYANKIKRAYQKTIKEVSELIYKLSLNPNNEFYFRNNPEVSKKVDDLLKSLYNEVYGTTVHGINTEWGLAVNKNNELAIYVMGDSLQELPDKYKKKYFTSNDGARNAFLRRKDNGFTLSEKVWKNTKQVKYELELALDVGIGKGKSAATLSRDIRGYLNEPDKLFRRVRDEKGVLRLSKAAKAYSPGQGRYRSSYKNSLRLTRNEINMSYESSQREKRDQQSFVVGVKIKVSPGHNPSDDKNGIRCVALQGNYPADFNWDSRWHTNCKCMSLNILKTKPEIDEDVSKILSGNTPNTKSKNQVNKNPDNFNSYIKKEKDMWKNWKSKPRFLVNS